jgi:DeoR family transcriptional regulator, fructose operon transcriptional repressor
LLFDGLYRFKFLVSSLSLCYSDYWNVVTGFFKGGDLLPRIRDSIFAEERQHLIVDLVNKEVTATVESLCAHFHVSPATIRSDLRELESSGLLRRTHGGAISNTRAAFEPDSYQKEVERISEKRAIAREAVKYVCEGDTIALDTGTTVFELAKLLTGFKELTVVTNDLQIASFLERESNAHILFAGGMVRTNFHCTVGPLTLSSLEGLNVDKAFIASNAFSLKNGLTTPNIDLASVKGKLIAIASEVYLLADSIKMGKTSFVQFASFSDIGIIITDDGISPESVQVLQDAGSAVQIVSVDGVGI